MLRFLMFLSFVFSVTNTNYVQRKLGRNLVTKRCTQEELAVLDTDGGIDDAATILIALRTHQIGYGPKIIGITCVNGMVDVDTAIINVGRTLRVVNRTDVPIYRGAESALIPPNVTFPKIFGNDAFEDIPYNPQGLPNAQSESAALYLVRIAKKYEGKLILFCMGPLTNIAVAMEIDPHFLTRLKNLVILGGSIHGVGNAAPGRDFNSYIDPYSFRKVISETSSKRDTMMPFETSLGVNIPGEFWVNLEKNGNPEYVFLTPYITVWLATNPPYHVWAVPLGYLAYYFNGITTSSDAYQVDCSISKETRGTLLVDFFRLLGNRTFNLFIITEINIEFAMDALIELFITTEPVQ